MRKGLLAAVIVASVAACGGGSGGGSSPAASKLFVADIGHGVIGCFPDVNPAAGTTLSGRTLSGVSAMGPSLAYDAANDRLYVTSAGGVAVYDAASTLSGTVAPTRTIMPAGVALLSATALFLDRTADVLYVGGNLQLGGAVVTFKHASTASGALAPDRIMLVNEGVNSFAIDSNRSLLYVVNSLVGVHVFEGASTATGALMAARHINFAASFGTSSVAVDSVHDRAYVADPFTGVYFVDGASAASGLQAGSAIAIPNAQYVTIDVANDRLYVGAYDKAYILGGASTLTGGAPPASSVGSSVGAGSSIAGFAFQ